MASDNRIWKWYRRHSHSINAILDIACSSIPGAGVAIGGIKLALAKFEDQAEEEQDRKAEDLERMLNEIRPIVGEIVEEIEEIESFQMAGSEAQRKEAISQSMVKEELERILPELGLSLSSSISQAQVLKGKYEILEKIGKGGQGEVYRGFHLLGQTPVAIKFLHKDLDETAISRLRIEYQRLLMRLVHPNIVQYRDLDQDNNGQYFLVMDFIDGKNLRRILMEKVQKPMEEVGKLLMPVALALDFAHENKIVHRDLKPENILVRERDGKVFLTDFGLSTEILSSSACKERNGDISGTLPYMAPEQYLGQPCLAATDNWALGVVAYEMLAGYHPFQGTSFEHYMKLVCEVEPPKIETLSGTAWKVLQKMFNKDRKMRPAKAEEWIKELLTSQSEVLILEQPESKSADLEASVQKNQLSKPIALKSVRFSIDKKQAELVRQEMEREKQKKEKTEWEAQKTKKTELARDQKSEEEWAQRAILIKKREEERKTREIERRKLEEEMQRKKAEEERVHREKRLEEKPEIWLPEARMPQAAKPKAPRYMLKELGIIRDTKTCLEWLVGRDEDMNWDEAKAWVDSISTFRYGNGWRMPTRKELRSLYESGEGKRNLSPMFKMIGWWVWAGNLKNSPISWAFDFYTGRESRYNRSQKVCGRAFAVRPGK